MANKSSINIDLDDPRAGKIAEVMSNKTAKAILNLLAEKEMSGSEIAEKMGIPLNTATYNLNKLVDAGLVGKSKRFFWSSKGKRMEIYKVLNKRIVIYPKSMSTKVVASILGILAVLVIALIVFNGQNQQIPGANIQGVENANSFDGTKSFSSYDELKDYLEENAGSDNSGGMFRSGLNKVAMEESFAADTAAMPSAAGAQTGTDSDGASDYSETNIQVEGVDEPDIVKNDGKYIYVVQGKNVFIIEAYPAESMKILDELEFEEYVSNIFINGDKLVVFGNEYEYIDTGIRCGEFFDIGVRCGSYSKQYTNVYVYDMADRENVELDEEIKLDGYFNNARMVDGFVYVVTTKYIELNYLDLPTHVFGGVETKIAADDVMYFDAPEDNYVFTTIAAIEIDSQEVETETFLMGASNTMYMSEDNIYLTYQKQLSQSYYFEKFVNEVLLEVLPASEKDKIDEVMDSDMNYREKTQEIGDIFEDYRRSLSGDELAEFLMVFDDKAEKFYEDIAKEQEMTVVNRIEVSGFNIDFEAQGEVPGRILNQFSMDEFEGNFRIATTTGGWNRERNLNNIYVMNLDMEIIGSVEDLAKGEQIYSARFMGERAYIVTFRQTDPLFAIDLSDPENPEVMGELKVTGYSGYLHPYDENHLLGIGMEATEQGRTQGVKVALFDVSDMSNPREIDSYEITEGEWSNSEAVYEHKAVLFDKEKNLLVIPVSYNKKTSVAGQSYPRYEYWQGAFVFDVSLEGIDLKGKIEHETDNDADEYYYGNSVYVKRSLFMDDVLYTVSDKFVKANSLGDLTFIEEVELPYEDYYGPYYGVAEGGMAVDAAVK